jgi:hypothetical protein
LYAIELKVAPAAGHSVAMAIFVSLTDPQALKVYAPVTVGVNFSQRALNTVAVRVALDFTT